MPFHKQGAYDGFDSVDEAMQHYKRCRTRKSFIMSDEAVANDDSLECARCKGKLKDKPVDDPDIPDSYHGNRCDYHPKTKVFAPDVRCYHYVCAWKGTLKAIAELPNR